MTAFFVVIWGLTYAFHNTSVKIVSWLIWGTSIILFAASVYYALIDALFFSQTRAFGQNLERMSNTLGVFSFLWGLAAVFIFASKRLFRRLHNKRVNDGDVVRRILLLVKDHHNLFGWVTLAAATAHGFYFLFHAPNTWFEFYSGVGAWFALVLLAVSGMWIGHVAKVPNRVKVMRISHIALTIGYAGAILLHIRGSIFLAGFLFAAAFLAMGLMWVIMRLTHSLKRH